MVTVVESLATSRWDEYVVSHPHASPYHLSAWLQSIETAYRHRCILLTALDESEVVTGVLPVVQLKGSLRQCVICSLPFCDVGGCLADSDSVRDALHKALFQYAQENGASQLEIRDCDGNENLPDKGKVRMMLELPATSDDLLAGFKSKLRSQIRKAEKNGLSFELDNSEESVDQFYRVWSRNMRDLGSPAHSRTWFQSIREYYAEQMTIGLVKIDNVVVAAGLLLFCRDTATIPWASTVAAYNKLAPNMLLYWNLLKYATDCGSARFDFGRSTLGEGTYKFKRQWGAKASALIWKSWDANREPIISSEGNSRIRPLAESMWRQLPVSFANTLGPAIRKHITL